MTHDKLFFCGGAARPCEISTDMLSSLFPSFFSFIVTSLDKLYFRLGAVHKWRHAPRGEGGHTFVTMRDEGEGGGLKKCDVTWKG